MKSKATIAAALALIFTTGFANAQETLTEAEKALADYLNAAALAYDATFDYGAYRVSGGDDGVIENLTARKVGTIDVRRIAAYFNASDDDLADIPEISYEIMVDYGDVAVSGLKDTGTGISYDEWTNLEEVGISAKIDADDIHAVITGGMTGVSARNGFSPMPENFSQMPGRPVGSLVSWLSSMNAGSTEKLSVGNGYLSLSAESEDGWVLGLTYEINDLKIENLTNGVAGKLKIAEAGNEMMVMDTNGDIVSETTTDQGTMLAEKYSLTGGLELFERDADPLARKTLVGKSTIYGYRSAQYEDDTLVELNVSKMHVENMTALPTGGRIVEAIDHLIVTDDEEVGPVVMGLLDLYRGFSVGLLSSEGVEIRLHDFSTSTLAEISAAEAEVADLSASGIGRMRAADFRVTGMAGGGEVEIRNIALRNVEFANGDPLVEIFEGITAGTIHDQPEITPAFILSRILPPAATLDIDGVHVTGENNLDLDYFRAEMKTERTAIPTLLRIKTRGLAFDADLLGHEADQLRRMGVETITHQNDLNLTWNEKTEELTLDNLMLEIGDLGVVEANLMLGGVPKAVLEDPETNGISLLATASIIKGKASFVDAGGIDRLISAHPELGGTRSAAKKLIENHIEARFSMFGPDFVNQATRAVDEMMNGAEKVMIEIAPENPVPLMRIAGKMTSAPHTLMKHLEARIYAE